MQSSVKGMPASSNFQEAIREAQSSALVGPNVVNKALPYVGGGMVLTAAGVLGWHVHHERRGNPDFSMGCRWLRLFLGSFCSLLRRMRPKKAITATALAVDWLHVQFADGLHAYRFSGASRCGCRCC